MFNLYEQFDLNFSNDPTFSTLALDESIVSARLKEYVSESDIHGSRRGTTYFPPVIYPQVRILSGDRLTKNKTLYTTNAHRGSKKDNSGQYSFTVPYPIPMINEHMSSGQCGSAPSKVYGRIIDAKVIKNNESGDVHLAGLGEVSEAEAVEEILTGRWLTGSLGSTVNTAKCSVCGHAFTSREDMEDHDHKKGAYYKSITKGLTTNEDAKYEPTDAKDKNAVLCYTSIESYNAFEYSKVINPSDNTSQVNIRDTRLEPGGHFSGLAPTQKNAPYEGPNPKENIPTSSLWIPMSKSSREGISSWGERYIDIITGREIRAEELGLPYGIQLIERVERLLDGNDGNDDFVSLESITQSHNFSAINLESVEDIEIHDDIINTVEETNLSEETTEDTEIPQEEKPYTTAGRKRLPASVFCGPDRSFPAGNLNHVKVGLRLLGKYKGPGDKGKIRACLMSKGRKMGYSPGNPTKKENVDTMSNTQENEVKNITHALSIVVEMPLGEEKLFNRFPCTTEDERKESLETLETLDEFIACLTDEQETDLRNILTNEVTEETESLYVYVDESNYLLLAAMPEVTVKSEAIGFTAESFLVDEQTLCDGSSRKDTLKHVREGLKTITKIYDLLENKDTEDNTEQIKKEKVDLIAKALVLLDENSTDTKDIIESWSVTNEVSYNELEARLTDLYTTTVEARKAKTIEKITENDTPLTELQVISPVLGVESSNNSEETGSNTEIIGGETVNLTGDILQNLRKAAGFTRPGVAKKLLGR